MIINQTSYKHNPNPNWKKPIHSHNINVNDGIKFFDQSGYALCGLELMYAKSNASYINSNREKQGIYMPWLECKSQEGVHINHSWLLERKGYAGEALYQLETLAKKYPMLYKISKLKPKWGIDISFDYVDYNGNVMELFHYEWDHFELDKVLTTKDHIETLVYDIDWEDFAKKKLNRKDEWKHLDFIAQSKWTTDFLDLPPESFKLVPWKL